MVPVLIGMDVNDLIEFNKLLTAELHSKHWIDVGAIFSEGKDPQARVSPREIRTRSSSPGLIYFWPIVF